MLDLSFRPNLPPLLRGGSDDVHTLVHYKHFVFGSESSEDPYNYVDIGVFFNTIFTAILVTIILIPNAFAQESTNIPDWVKNNAGWWATDQIDDSAFVQGIQYLVQNGIIVI